MSKTGPDNRNLIFRLRHPIVIMTILGILFPAIILAVTPPFVQGAVLDILFPMWPSILYSKGMGEGADTVFLWLAILGNGAYFGFVGLLFTAPYPANWPLNRRRVVAAVGTLASFFIVQAWFWIRFGV